jgi:hypothetical protein
LIHRSCAVIRIAGARHDHNLNLETRPAAKLLQHLDEAGSALLASLIRVKDQDDLGDPVSQNHIEMLGGECRAARCDRHLDATREQGGAISVTLEDHDALVGRLLGLVEVEQDAAFLEEDRLRGIDVLARDPELFDLFLLLQFIVSFRQACVTPSESRC